MTLFSSDSGIYRFALNENELISLTLSPESIQAHFNLTEPYAIPLEGLREIRIESQSQLHFHPSPHNEYLAELMDSLVTEKGFCVDIGAYDGLNYSHTLPFFQKGWKGLAVECDAGRFSRLAHIYRMFEDVNLSRQKVTPHNVCSLLRSADIPQNFELLSLDIDSYDYFVLEALLSEYRPSVICAEINEVIPLPVKFAVKYDPAFQLDLNTRFYGQSLAMLAALCERYNYAILRMYYMDVFLIDRQYIDGETQSLEQLYKEGLLDLPRPPYYQAYPFDVEAVWAAEPEAAAEMVRQGFETVKTAPFICEI